MSKRKKGYSVEYATRVYSAGLENVYFVSNQKGYRVCECYSEPMARRIVRALNREKQQ